jgi:hypothetical protein
MMATLILVVCLAATPDVCREEQPPVDANAMSCAVQGQIMAQEWLDEHPKWLLRGWRCRFGRPERGA